MNALHRRATSFVVTVLAFFCATDTPGVPRTGGASSIVGRERSRYGDESPLWQVAEAVGGAEPGAGAHGVRLARGGRGGGGGGGGGGGRRRPGLPLRLGRSRVACRGGGGNGCKRNAAAVRRIGRNPPDVLLRPAELRHGAFRGAPIGGAVSRQAIAPCARGTRTRPRGRAKPGAPPTVSPQ